ncbi:MAG: hypothetical protein ACJAVM_002690, partial [Sulfitobacter sp.]
MHSQGGKNDVLIRAALAARHARDHELEKRLLDPSLVELFNAILDHAFLLPLMELKLNHCTSFQGGQILAQQNLAHPYCFSSVTPRFFGKTFDLPPEAPSFITRVCGFGFHIVHRQFGQARRARSPQVAQALGA